MRRGTLWSPTTFQISKSSSSFKQDEGPHVLQKQLRVKEPRTTFQPVFQQRPVVFALDRIPPHEPFLVGRQRTDLRRNSIADNETSIVLE